MSMGESFTIIAVGDIIIGTTYPVDVFPPEDGKEIFKAVQQEFHGGDVILGNLEGPLCDQGTPMKCKTSFEEDCFEFVMPTRYARHLKEAGFSVLNIANNHSLDFGCECADNTVVTLRDAGIQATGGKTTARINKNGKRIVVIGFSYKASAYAHSICDVLGAQKIVANLKKDHDIIIVSFHGGAEGTSALHIPKGDEIFLNENRGNVIKFAHAVVDAGADIVIGHGPHVLRAMEVYKGKLIAYSLGNFLTYGLFNLNWPRALSVILKVRIDAATGNFIDGRLVPVKLANGGIPKIAPTDEPIRLIKALTETDIGPQSILIEDTGAIRPNYQQIP